MFSTDDALGREAKHGALGDVDDLLARAQRLGARERDLRHLGDQLLDRAVAADIDAPLPVAMSAPLANEATTFIRRVTNPCPSTYFRGH